MVLGYISMVSQSNLSAREQSWLHDSKWRESRIRFARAVRTTRLLGETSPLGQVDAVRFCGHDTVGWPLSIHTFIRENNVKNDQHSLIMVAVSGIFHLYLCHENLASHIQDDESIKYVILSQIVVAPSTAEGVTVVWVNQQVVCAKRFGIRSCVVYYCQLWLCCTF